MQHSRIDFEAFGDRVAVIHQNGRLSYKDFDALVDLLCGKLDALGLVPGDRVAARLGNSLELLTSYYACLRSGLVIVPIDERLSFSEVKLILDHATPRCLIVTDAKWRERPTLDGYGDVVVLALDRIDTWVDAGYLPTLRSSSSWPADHPAVIFYTSGSTGESKGVLYSHATLAGNSRVYGEGLQINPNDIAVLCHCMSANFVFAQLTVPFLDRGACVQIVDYGSVGQTLDAIAAGATFLSLIPWLGFQLIAAGRSSPGRQNRLRSCEIGGDRVPLSFFESFEEVFGIYPREHLGMAETNTTVVNPMREGDYRLGSVGIPLPEVEIEVRTPDRRPMPPGADGEIWVKTPAAMAGYWGDPEATSDVMVDGWVATGDKGHLDTDGYLWFTGRIKQIIICDGDNVFPGEIEQEIERHPLVDRACVVGLPHAIRGEVVAAAIILSHPGEMLTQPELAAFLSVRMSDVKIPQVIRLVDLFPETAAGKVDRQAVAVSMRSFEGQALMTND